MQLLQHSIHFHNKILSSLFLAFLYFYAFAEIKRLDEFMLLSVKMQMLRLYSHIYFIKNFIHETVTHI